MATAQPARNCSLHGTIVTAVTPCSRFKDRDLRDEIPAARSLRSDAMTTGIAHHPILAPHSRTCPPRGITPQMGVQSNPGAEKEQKEAGDRTGRPPSGD